MSMFLLMLLAVFLSWPMVIVLAVVFGTLRGLQARRLAREGKPLPTWAERKPR